MNIPREKRLHPLTGAALFVICALWLLFGQSVLSQTLGIYGTAVSELFILLLALFPVAVGKVRFGDVFPMRKISMRTIAGLIVLFIGSLFLTTTIANLTGFFFPEGMAKTADGLSEAMTEYPYLITFITVAVIAPICEEALFRGAIMSAFSGLRSKTLLIAIIGVLFGLMHMDPYRFLITAVLGAVLAYIMLETRNIFMPVLFHFINNTVSMFSLKFLDLLKLLEEMPAVGVDLRGLLAEQNVYSALTVGPYVAMYGLLAPMILFGGIAILKGGRERTPESAGETRMRLLVASLISAVLSLTGVGIIISGLL